MLLVRDRVALENTLDDIDLGRDQLALRTESDHRQGIGDDVHFLRQILERFYFGQIAVDVNLEGRFNRFDVGLHRLGNGFQ